MNEIIDAATAAATQHTQKMSKPLISTIVESQELRNDWMVSEAFGAMSEENLDTLNDSCFFNLQPICNHSRCQDASEELFQQLKQMWASPPTMYQLITTYQPHMAKQSLLLPR